MNGPVLVTGASGNAGSAVLASLRSAGTQVRAAGTNPSALARVHPDVDVVKLDFLDPATFEPALDGVEGVFLLRPPAIARVGPTLNAFIDVAVRTRAGHVVFSSVTGADTNRFVPHHKVESHLMASGLPWTILRPGFFAQNLADAYRIDIVGRNRIVLPAGRGRAAFIDVRDVGEVAAAILRDPEPHTGSAYTLTGPQALGFEEVATILTAELGRHVRYEPVSVLRYALHLKLQGMGLAQTVVQTVLHAGLRRGQADHVDPTLARLLHRAPHALEQYVHDFRSVWAVSPQSRQSSG
ncbi:NmrA family NAD(P)-binding protein [Cellulomonas sp. 179-A 4D5 NHS]|uniref:NmrA family NAD(P)-binding protein n=1 Tax=Cellulomonas sp. 179-A 4D5 NHS TaxID=3142378 RepID=UPI0039A1173E